MYRIVKLVGGARSDLGSGHLCGLKSMKYEEPYVKLYTKFKFCYKMRDLPTSFINSLFFILLQASFHFYMFYVLCFCISSHVDMLYSSLKSLFASPHSTLLFLSLHKHVVNLKYIKHFCTSERKLMTRILYNS